MFYAVRKGRLVGVFDNWKDTEKQVNGYKGSEFRKFNTKDAADKWLNEVDVDVVRLGNFNDDAIEDSIYVRLHIDEVAKCYTANVAFNDNINTLVKGFKLPNATQLRLFMWSIWDILTTYQDRACSGIVFDVDAKFISEVQILNRGDIVTKCHSLQTGIYDLAHRIKGGVYISASCN